MEQSERLRSCNETPATFRVRGAGRSAKGVPVRDGRWGYRLLVVDDPDGNQLYFNYPNEPT